MLHAANAPSGEPSSTYGHAATSTAGAGVLNIAGALPFALAPAVAPAVLAVGGGSYALLYVVAGVCATLGALAITRVRGVR